MTIETETCLFCGKNPAEKEFTEDHIMYDPNNPYYEKETLLGKDWDNEKYPVREVLVPQCSKCINRKAKLSNTLFVISLLLSVPLAALGTWVIELDLLKKILLFPNKV